MRKARGMFVAAVVAASLAIPAPSIGGSYALTLDLSGHLQASGRLRGTGDPAPSPICGISRTIRIQRRRPDRWRTVATDQTNNQGRYSTEVPDRPGRYRARAPRENGCPAVVSSIQRHQH